MQKREPIKRGSQQNIDKSPLTSTIATKGTVVVEKIKIANVYIFLLKNMFSLNIIFCTKYSFQKFLEINFQFNMYIIREFLM